MRKLRAAIWSLAVGVLALAAAGMLFRLLPGHGLVFVALLVLCVAGLSLLLGLLAEIPPAAGAGAGFFAVALVAVVLGLTIAAAPLQPGAHRPGLADLLWLPLVALLGALAVSGAAGWLGLRAGLRLARRPKVEAPIPDGGPKRSAE